MKTRRFSWLALIPLLALSPVTSAALDRPLVIKWAHCLATNEPTHIAALPVAVNLNCSAPRRITITI